jgi:hypothetical protein
VREVAGVWLVERCEWVGSSNIGVARFGWVGFGMDDSSGLGYVWLGSTGLGIN